MAHVSGSYSITDKDGRVRSGIIQCATAFWILSSQTLPVSAAEDRDLQPLIDSSRELIQVHTADDLKNPTKQITAMRWANNARGSANGATLLYIKRGRPQAVCCIYPWQGYLRHEFNSLALGPLRAMRDGQIVWFPNEPGIKLSPVPGNPSVASNANRRKLQLSQIARQFKGQMTGWKSDDSDRELLRLLGKPIYRYQSENPQLIDGAVFAFAQGTDPEILLLLEAWRENDAEKPLWKYAFVRRTSGGLKAWHKETLVWEAEKFPANRDASSTYVVLTGEAVTVAAE